MSWQAHGYRAWFLQRLSAIYIAGCLLFIIGFLLLNSIPTFDHWQSFFFSPVANILILLFFLAIMVHAWIGIRDVIIDYVHFPIIRVLVLNFLMLFLISMTLWITYILFTLVKL